MRKLWFIVSVILSHAVEPNLKHFTTPVCDVYHYRDDKTKKIMMSFDSLYFFVKPRKGCNLYGIPSTSKTTLMRLVRDQIKPRDLYEPTKAMKLDPDESARECIFVSTSAAKKFIEDNVSGNNMGTFMKRVTVDYIEQIEAEYVSVKGKTSTKPSDKTQILIDHVERLFENDNMSLDDDDDNEPISEEMLAAFKQLVIHFSPYFDKIFADDFLYWGETFTTRHLQTEEHMMNIWIYIFDHVGLSQNQYVKIYNALEPVRVVLKDFMPSRDMLLAHRAIYMSDYLTIPFEDRAGCYLDVNQILTYLFNEPTIHESMELVQHPDEEYPTKYYVVYWDEADMAKTHSHVGLTSATINDPSIPWYCRSRFGAIFLSVFLGGDKNENLHGHLSVILDQLHTIESTPWLDPSTGQPINIRFVFGTDLAATSYAFGHGNCFTGTYPYPFGNVCANLLYNLDGTCDVYTYRHPITKDVHKAQSEWNDYVSSCNDRPEPSDPKKRHTKRKNYATTHETSTCDEPCTIVLEKSKRFSH